MNNTKLLSLIGFIKPQIKKQKLLLYFIINMTKLDINNTLANYYNFTNTLNTGFFKFDFALQIKTSVRKLALLVIQKIAWPLMGNKQRVNKWSFVLYSFIRHKNIGHNNKNMGRTPANLERGFELTNKKLVFLSFKKLLKKTQIFFLFLKEKIKQNSLNSFSFFIKTISFKIINIFIFFGVFFCLFVFLQKIIYFMCTQKSLYYKEQLFLHENLNRLTTSKDFFNKQIIHVILQWILNKTQKIFVKKRFYNLAIKKLYYNKVNDKKACFHGKVCFYFCLRKYNPFFGSVRKLLRAFFIVKNALFCVFKILKNEQLFLCLRKIFQFYNKKTYFTFTKTKKYFVSVFYVGLQEQRFGNKRSCCAKKKRKTKLWCKRHFVKLRKTQITCLKSFFNKTIQAIKNVFNQQYFFIITNTFVTKIKKIVLKLASFVTFFLSKTFWKWAKKQHPQRPNKYLLFKYWIFIEKLARFYFFEKVN